MWQDRDSLGRTAISIASRGVLVCALAMTTALLASADAANRKMHTALVQDGSDDAVLPVTAVSPAAQSRLITVDSAFESQFGFLVPQPFALHLPKDSDGQINAAFPDTIEGVYLRISFSTLADGLVEELDVIPLRIADGEASRRRHIMSRLLITRVFADLTSRYINKSLDGVNIYALSGTDAVVLNGTYWDPRAGNIAVRIYAIMPKGGEDGLIFYERRYIERAPQADRLSEQVVRSVTFD